MNVYLIPELNFLNIQILAGNGLWYDSMWGGHSVKSDCSRLYLLKNGRASVSCKQYQIDLVPGKLYLFPNGRFFDYSCTDKIELFWVHFTIEFIPGLSVFNSFTPQVSIDLQAGQAELFESIISDLDKTTTAGMMQKYANMLALLSDFFPSDIHKTLPSRQDFEHFRVVSEYLNKYPERQFDLKQLARMVNLHPTYFSNRFKKIFGVPPLHFLIVIRMEKARTLLLNTNLSVSEIGRQCGYADEFFFSRTFKKYMDISPAKIRHKTRRVRPTAERI